MSLSIENKKNRRILMTLFWVLVVVFVVAASFFLIPALRDFLGFPLMAASGFAFLILGAALVFLTRGLKVKGRLRKFLILTGASSAGLFISVVLHNAFYALGTVVSHIAVLKYLVGFLEIVFFFVAVPICPVGFLVGAVGSIVMFLKKEKKEVKEKQD
jgi:lysylphosphatidylglycerol synthetase-like protein (DUF2156 family)